jgi:hypothetical protein
MKIETISIETISNKICISGASIDSSAVYIDSSAVYIDSSAVYIDSSAAISSGTCIEDPLLKSIKVNYIFYSTLVICLYMISYYTNSNFIWCIISFMYISVKGYFVHYLSHKYNLLENYILINNYITRIPLINNLSIFFCKMFDFHSNIHHDSSINKNIDNKIYEFIINFFTQSGFFLIFIYFTKYLNYYVCFLWGLFYSTVHMINYDILKPISHKHHHVDYKTNYDIMFWDTIFDTKYDYNDSIEDINMCSINVIILTLMIICFVKYI